MIDFITIIACVIALFGGGFCTGMMFTIDRYEKKLTKQKEDDDDENNR